MKPLFTVHAGELLVGEYIEKRFRQVNIWVPSRDTGVDLLVTDAKNQKMISLQVKFSRDFLVTERPAEFQQALRACGWWTLKRQKIAQSNADYWVFVLIGFAHRSTDFVVVKPSELLARLDSIHHQDGTIQNYFWVTQDNRCWEARGLKRSEEQELVEGRYINDPRDFTEYLNRWQPIETLESHSA